MSNSDYVNQVLADQFTAIRDELNHTEVVELMADVVRQLAISGVKTVSVIGGAASGKSTIAEELKECLTSSGTPTDILSTDDYVVGDKEYRQVKLKYADAQKKYDFERMDEQVRAIKRLDDENAIVVVPVVDPDTGVAVEKINTDDAHEVGKVDVLVIEGDFPRDDYDIRFYIHVSDGQRLRNNIERAEQLGDDVDAGKMIDSFNDRQRTLHKPYTLPALQSADYVLVTDAVDDTWIYKMYQRNQ